MIDFIALAKFKFRILIGLLVISSMALAGCGKSPETQKPNPSLENIQKAPTNPEKSDPRSRWVYEKGWFAKGQGENWFEHNEEANRIRGKAWEFRQTKSTKEYIEMYDASRGVTIRLSETSAEARWDNEGKDAAFKVLFPGRWEEGK